MRVQRCCFLSKFIILCKIRSKVIDRKVFNFHSDTIVPYLDNSNRIVRSFTYGEDFALLCFLQCYFTNLVSNVYGSQDHIILIRNVIYFFYFTHF